MEEIWPCTSHLEGLGGALHRCSVADEDDMWGSQCERFEGPSQTRLGWETGCLLLWSLSQTTEEPLRRYVAVSISLVCLLTVLSEL